MAYSDLILADSPHLYFKWGTNAGTPAQLGSKTVTVTSNAVSAVTGMGGVDYAGSFNGTSSYVKAAGSSNNTFNGTNWSVEAWFKRGTQIGYQEIVNVNDANNNLAILQWWTGGDDKKIVALFKGNAGTQIAAKSAAITDTNWHHVAATYASGTLKLYIDGYEVDSASGGTTGNFGTSVPIRVGAYGDTSNTENWAGLIDEVGIYNTTLTASKVLGRYATGAGININDGHTATPATGAGTAPDARVVKEIKSMVIADANVGTTTNGSATSLSGTVVVKAPVSLPEEVTIVSATLVLHKLNSTGTFGLVTPTKVTSDWTETSTSSVTTHSSAMPGDLYHKDSNTKIYLDVTPAALDWHSGEPDYGIHLWLNGAEIATRENITPSYRPYIVYQIVPLEVSVWATPALGSGDAPDAAMEITYDSVSLPAPFVGEAEMADAIVEIYVGAVAEPGYATGTMPGAFFMRPVEVAVEVAEATGEIMDATTELDVNGYFEAAPFVGTGHMDLPEEARRDEDDPYFRRIRDTTDEDDHWFRLNEKVGAGLRVRTHEGGTGNLLQHDASYDPVWNIEPQRGIVGPVGRRAVRLSGSQYITREYQNTLAYPEPGRLFVAGEFAFETVIRTTQKDSILFAGHDALTTGPAPYGVVSSIVAELRGGKVDAFGARGFTDIADGNWHHIAISVKLMGFDENNLDAGVVIYIDGKLDARKTMSGHQEPMFIIPDYWFGVSSFGRGVLDTDAATRGLTWRAAPNFVGDVMEVVYRYRSYIGQHQVQRLYYDAMGITPFEAAPFRAAAVVSQPKARGNQKRMLVLWFRSNSERPGGASRDRFPGDFDFGPGIPRPDTMYHWNPSATFLAGHHVFFLCVDHISDLNGGAGGLRRDPRTDLPRLLDLEHDVDIDDFDVIAYDNWPDEGVERDVLFKTLGMPSTAIDDHLNSLRNVMDKYGISLWVANPTLATELGIIETAELVDTLTETTNTPGVYIGPNQIGAFDGRAQEIHPWVATPDGSYDTHRNNRERLVANVPGFTDRHPWYLLDDAVMFAHRALYTRLTVDYSFKYKDVRDVVDEDGNIITPGGPKIGDEWIEPTILANDMSRFNTNTGWTRTDQYRRQVYGVAPGKVKAGLVVTKFGANHWVGANPAKQVPNPYAEYAASIIVQPGETVNGRPAGGKILVTLMHDPNLALLGNLEAEGFAHGVDSFKIQMVPSDDWFTQRGLTPETPEERAWQYTTWRLAVGFTPTNTQFDQAPNTGAVVPVVAPDGTMTWQPAGGATLQMVTAEEIYPVKYIKVYSTVKAGVAWLSDRTGEHSTGGRIKRAAVFDGEGAMPKPAVKGGSSVRITVTSAASGNGQLRSPEGYEQDTMVLPFAAVGTGHIVPNTRSVQPSPANGDGVLRRPLIMTNRAGITLFVTRQDSITIYLEEL